MWELCEAGKNTSYAQCTSSLPASQTWCKAKFWCLKWWCHIFSDLLRFEWRMLENQISNEEMISKVQREYEENENEWSFWGYFLTSSQDIGVVNKDYRGILSAKNALKYFVCIHCFNRVKYIFFHIFKIFILIYVHQMLSLLRYLCFDS